MIICHGCGQAFPLPASYTRNKIQCPACGVICAVPAGASSAPAPAPRTPATPPPPTEEADVVRWLHDPAPEQTRAAADVPEVEVVLPREEPASGLPPRPKSRELLFSCRRCGRMIPRQRECPVCDAEDLDVLPVEPSASAPPARGPSSQQWGLDDHPTPGRPLSLELDDEPLPVLPGADDLDEETTPYVLADKDHPICTNCRRPLEVGAVLCTACGFNLKTRKKAQRTYQPLDRTWDTGLSLPGRLAWLAGLQGIHMVLGGLSALVLGYWKPFVVTWPFFTLLALFILGTYDKITIRRDRRGRVTVTKHWYALFIPLAPKVTEVRGFEGVVTGQWANPGVFEYFVLITLIPVGLIPAIIYYYAAIHLPYFHVALALDHGRSDVYVYRGRSLAQMEQIRDFLCDAAELRHLG